MIQGTPTRPRNNSVTIVVLTPIRCRSKAYFWVTFAAGRAFHPLFTSFLQPSGADPSRFCSKQVEIFAGHSENQMIKVKCLHYMCLYNYICIHDVYINVDAYHLTPSPLAILPSFRHGWWSSPDHGSVRSHSFRHTSSSSTPESEARGVGRVALGWRFCAASATNLDCTFWVFNDGSSKSIMVQWYNVL